MEQCEYSAAEQYPRGIDAHVAHLTCSAGNKILVQLIACRVEDPTEDRVGCAFPVRNRRMCRPCEREKKTKRGVEGEMRALADTEIDQGI